MLLYPRLSPQQGKELAEQRATLTPLELEALASSVFEHVTYAPTGGVRITSSQLAHLQKCIQETATRHGYAPGLAGGEPLPLDAEQKGSFDAALAVTLHEKMQINAAEGSRPGVWRFLGTVLAPQFIRWRFPGEKTTHERFLGNRLRNMYGRVWWRAELLRDDSNEDPYWLLTELGEDELVQITERPNAAGYAALAVGIARALVERWNSELGVSRSGLLREVMKRLLRLLPLVRFEALDAADVTAEIDVLVDETLRGLGIELESVDIVPEPEWNRDTQWQDLALNRRARFIKGLTDVDITRLSALVDSTLPEGGEYRPRWKTLFQINATAGQVLELTPEPEGLPRGAQLGQWLTAAPAGSWQTEVDPARGKRLFSAIRGPDMQALFHSLGWDWPEGMTHSGSQRYIRRRYSGEWAALLRALTDEAAAHLAGFLRLEDTGAPRLALARWLTVSPQLDWSAATTETSVVSEAVIPAPPGTGDALDLEARIPRPEPRLANVLERAGVKTVRDLVGLDFALLERMAGVGPVVVSGIRAFRGDVLAGVLSQAGPIEAPLEPELATQELPDAPGLIANLLRKLEVRTYGALFELDLFEVSNMSGVGRKKVETIRAFQQELASRADAPAADDSIEPAADLGELATRLLDGLSEREATLVSLRFEQGATLSAAGEVLDLSRERVRQIVRAMIRRLHGSHGNRAAALLEQTGGGYDGKAYDLDTAEIEPWQALLIATVAHDAKWTLLGTMLWSDTEASLSSLKAQITDAIQGTHLGPDGLRQVAETVDSPATLVELLLTSRMGWVERDGELVFPEDEMPRDEWVLMRLKEAGPSHQKVVGQWLMEREGVPEAAQAANTKKYGRVAESLLSRLDDAWRWDRGTFIHTSGIPVSGAELQAMVDWCVERVVGRTGPYGVQKLLEELAEAGFGVDALNHYVLKDALVRDEALIALRKGNVACANSYDEHGVDLLDRVQTALHSTPRPMTMAEIAKALPGELSVSDTALRQLLYSNEGIESAGRGLFRLRVSDMESSL